MNKIDLSKLHNYIYNSSRNDLSHSGLDHGNRNEIIGQLEKLRSYLWYLDKEIVFGGLIRTLPYWVDLSRTFGYGAFPLLLLFYKGQACLLPVSRWGRAYNPMANIEVSFGDGYPRPVAKLTISAWAEPMGRCARSMDAISALRTISALQRSIAMDLNWSIYSTSSGKL